MDTATALLKFKEEVCDNALALNADDMDWHTLSFGFFLALGFDAEQAYLMASDVRYVHGYWQGGQWMSAFDAFCLILGRITFTLIVDQPWKKQMRFKSHLRLRRESRQLRIENKALRELVANYWAQIKTLDVNYQIMCNLYIEQRDDANKLRQIIKKLDPKE